ncbi:Uncharacterized protein TCM_023639 [Theobroma cacao]|uniref:CCHC-type domain-containing protein n=1 Tax=Theobroma cacao TaxID=3641 RepID=A0A061EWB4_THECC|nr:Uncharacterized protein TCM_023639 [Theobroma cacao]
MDRFLLESVRDAKAQEFETLVQAPRMIVSNYDIQFTQLSRYAPYLVQTERERIKRFIKGLHRPIYRILVSQRFTSYPEVVDAARKIEAGHTEVRVERERSKKNQGEGSSKYRDPSRGEDVNIAGQQGQRDGNLLRGSAFFSPPNQRKNFQFRSPPRSSDFSGVTYKWAMSNGITNSNPRQSGRWGSFCTFCGQIHTGPCNQMTVFCYECGGIGHVKSDCPTHRHNHEMARSSI